jgi:hypothetical protein
MKSLTILLVVCAGLSAGEAQAQTVEAFGGSQKTTLDVMFFKFFLLPKTTKTEAAASAEATAEVPRSNFLFFFRARAAVGYRDPDTLPQFGLTSAVSYNHPVLKGFAPVAVGQIFNRGVFPKAGVQFAKVDKKFTIFTWLVCETLPAPVLDYFLLARYTLTLTDLLGLYFQVESINAFPTDAGQAFSFTERARFGLQIHRWQIGPGVDFSHVGRNAFTHSFNVGGFVRYEF